MIRKAWNFMGGVRLTFWLLVIIFLDLAAGSYIVRFFPGIFRPLSTGLLQDWYALYGRENLHIAWWLILLVALLAALSLNTAICATNRIADLWRARRQIKAPVFFYRITPSLAHVCFLVMLAGHFLSMTTGFQRVVSVYPGATLSLPSGEKIEIIDQHCENYSRPEIISGPLKQCGVTMKLPDKKAVFQEISFLDSFSWHGLTFHLGMDKKSRKLDLKLTIKRDPGALWILSGFTVLILLMMWYFLKINNKENKGGIL